MAAVPRRILVPTDFSAGAERALRLAVRLAARLDAEIHLMHVRVLLEDPHLRDGYPDEVERMLAEGEEAAHAALARRAEEAHVAIRTHLVRRLAPAEAIVETAAELGCDLVVIGSHGHRGLKHLLLGSVTEEVIRTAPVPVLVVREDAPVDDEAPRRLLVPHDFSDRSAAALSLAAAWARALGAEVRLLHVVEPVVYPDFYAVDLMPEEMLERIRERSETSLRQAGGELLEGLPWSTEVVVGRAATAVVGAVAEGDGLVVMGTHGLSGLEHVLLGSVTEAVVRRCPVPVLTVRSR